MDILGIDIGGTGIKGAPVNTYTGSLKQERVRLLTPHPATPAKVAKLVHKIAQHFAWRGAIGVGFPGVVQKGRVLTAANLDKRWIGKDAESLFREATGCAVTVINDADAAGLAEMRFGAGRGHQGKVLLLTLGTGIGSALFLNGKLVSNTEFGHLEIRGKIAERRASDRVRQRKKLSWKKWAGRVQEYLDHLSLLLSPDLIILGGGAVKDYKKFSRYLELPAAIKPAESGNLAGIVGAALAAQAAHRNHRPLR
ncbi:MAG: ROK family protein [candidate division KSB1 bacterium]|nr:ROK family protein [candidate division KSB1 bacterium]MDZ7275269.1 ROK family protein [candidate division KSB1 bacterium]MDZ7287437.1 ROK family protein [candidate division KSB1 bacterium]MDZ7299551.1 ROK family protein [candidate division KSB1 bacterium]MDZ7308009.1 ROK family protein [candidate division KSB1 bacterium]